MYKLIKRRATSLALLLLLLLLPITVLASDAGIYANLRAGQIVDGPGFYAGEVVQIDGTVNGTTFAVGQNVVVNGTIQGDLLTAAQEIVVNGTVTGNIYAAGQIVEVNGQVKGDIFGAGQKIRYNKDAVLERDAFAAGQNVILTGTIGRKLFAAAESVALAGTVGNDARIEANNVHLNEGAQINGDLVYTSSSQAYIAPGAKVSGITTWNVAEKKPPVKAVNKLGQELGGFVVSILSALLFWFLISLWRPAFWTATTRTITAAPLKTLGFGALTLLITPLAVILLLVTVIGIPLGIILGIVYGVSIWLSHIIVAVFAGYWLAQRFRWPELHKGVWLVLLGLSLLALLGKLPFVGFLVNLAVILAGLGAMVLTFAKPQSPPQPPEFPAFAEEE